MRNISAFVVLPLAALLLLPPLRLAGADDGKVSASTVSVPDELRALDTRFLELRRSHVTAPHDDGVSKLIAGYLKKLGLAEKEQLAAGHLDVLLAVRQEMELVSTRRAVPERDEGSEPAILKGLRAAFWGDYMKLNAAQAKDTKILADWLDTQLTLLAGRLTTQGRLPDVKKVQEYREAMNKADARKGPPAAGSAKGAVVNTLGMTFVPVKGVKVLFCIHETRRKDYAAFAMAAQGVDDTWKAVFVNGLPVGDKDDHPVVGVSYNDALTFCAWLSHKEGRTYRLPTDREWSVAAGIGRDEKEAGGATPRSLSDGVHNRYPWGRQWPPPAGAGNFADTAFKAKIPGMLSLGEYADGHATTAPVMSFAPDEQGLYDMSGNAEEWVGDWWNAEKLERVLRGGSWMQHFSEELLSSHRNHARPDDRSNAGAGFRCVLVMGAGT